MQISRESQLSSVWLAPMQSGLAQLGNRCQAIFTAKRADEPKEILLTELLEREIQGAENDFVGITSLITKQKDQLMQFEAWADQGRYDLFSTHHFDWWMFPTNRRSARQGGKYTVHEYQIEALQRRPIFMQRYRRGVALLLCSWGWDLYKRRPITELHFDGHLVRLGKVLQSLELFGEKNLFNSVQRFARQVVAAEHLIGQWEYLRPWIWPEK